MEILLCKREAQHVLRYFEKAQDPEIKRLLPQRASTPEEALADYRATLGPDATSYGRTIYAGGVYVGDIWCYALHQAPDPDAMVSYCIFEKAYWNRGVATRALALFLSDIQPQFGLRRIGAFTYAHNAGSVRVLERNGFQLSECFQEDGVESRYYLYRANAEQFGNA